MDDPWLMNNVRRNDKAEIARLRAKTEELSKALDAMTAERDVEYARNVETIQRAEKAEAERDAARAKALEDAAKLAERVPNLAHPSDYAAAIRAMIEQEHKG